MARVAGPWASIHQYGLLAEFKLTILLGNGRDTLAFLSTILDIDSVRNRPIRLETLNKIHQTEDIVDVCTAI